MKMEDCNKFDSCSAPICPLDEDYKIRTHLTGERVCLYLREYAKKDTLGDLKVSVPTEMFNRLAMVSKDILSRPAGDKLGGVKLKLKAASEGKSKMFNKNISPKKGE